MWKRQYRKKYDSCYNGLVRNIFKVSMEAYARRDLRLTCYVVLGDIPTSMRRTIIPILVRCLIRHSNYLQISGFTDRDTMKRCKGMQKWRVDSDIHEWASEYPKELSAVLNMLKISMVRCDYRTSHSTVPQHSEWAYDQVRSQITNVAIFDKEATRQYFSGRLFNQFNRSAPDLTCPKHTWFFFDSEDEVRREAVFGRRQGMYIRLGVHTLICKDKLEIDLTRY